MCAEGSKLNFNTSFPADDWPSLSNRRRIDCVRSCNFGNEDPGTGSQVVHPAVFSALVRLQTHRTNIQPSFNNAQRWSGKTLQREKKYKMKTNSVVMLCSSRTLVLTLRREQSTRCSLFERTKCCCTDTHQLNTRQAKARQD